MNHQIVDSGDSMAKEGEDFKRISLRVPIEHYKNIKSYGKAHGLNDTAVVNKALKSFFDLIAYRDDTGLVDVAASFLAFLESPAGKDFALDYFEKYLPEIIDQRIEEKLKKVFE